MPVKMLLVRVDLAERFLEEAKAHLRKGDPVQASEKLYKVAEECTKALAGAFNVPELEEVRKRGSVDGVPARQCIQVFGKKLDEPRIEYAWAIAYDIHVWGSHEAKYGIEEIEGDVTHMEWLLNYTKKLVEEREGQGQRNA